jgi:predicted MPP superfamily phosphohydrolase
MWRMILFATIASLVWAGAHVFVGWSLGRLIRRRRLKYVVWAVLAASFTTTFGALVLPRAAPNLRIPQGVEWLAYVSIGAFVLLLFLVVVRDVIFLAIAVARKALAWTLGRRTSADPSHPSDEVDQPVDPSRRELFQGAINSSLIGVAAVGTGLGYREARRLADVVEVDVEVDGLDDALDGFTIAQVSDVHVGATITGAYLAAVVERVNALDADLIAFTGDLVDGFVEDKRHETAHIANFEARYGTYFVTGNHEYYWDANAWCDEVERCGVHVLNNTHRVVEVDGAPLVVGGVTDYRAGSRLDGHASDPHLAIQGAPPEAFRLLLAHQPKSVWEAAEAGFDLQLSGHTHGGQFWPWSLFVGLAHPFYVGLNDYEDMKIYVNRGTGYWGPPMRLGVPSEITLLTLRRSA